MIQPAQGADRSSWSIWPPQGEVAPIRQRFLDLVRLQRLAA
jgi:hypothetical protein